jgi:hypothetical protein
LDALLPVEITSSVAHDESGISDVRQRSGRFSHIPKNSTAPAKKTSPMIMMEQQLWSESMQPE